MISRHDDMLNRHTYDYLSSKHIGTSLFLLLLPSELSLAILQKQRTNMVTFLRKNEADALEDVKKYWNFDQQTWLNIMNETKEDIAFNLNALKDTHNYNVPHDPNLPIECIIAAKNECNRYNFNINNLKLETSNDIPLHVATTKTYKPDRTLDGTKQYVPTEINFNTHSISNLDPHTCQHIYTHEFTHITEGHNIQNKNILFAATVKPGRDKQKQIENIDNETEELSNSIEKMGIWDYIIGNRDKAEKKRDKLIAESDILSKEIILFLEEAISL
jgi:hypothetical protein